MMQSILFWTTATLYALATCLHFFGAVFQRPWTARVAFALAGVGLLPHAASLALRWVEVGHGPYQTRYEVVSANAFLLVLVYLGACLRSRELRGLGVFLMPRSPSSAWAGP
jgi:ABC-type transport system involved in cytochrome c biogenesis permease subunit